MTHGQSHDPLAPCTGPRAARPLPAGRLLSCVAALLLGGGTAAAQQPAAQSGSSSAAGLLAAFESKLVEVIQRVEPSVVAISRAPAPRQPQAASPADEARLRSQFQPGELQALQQLDRGFPGVDPLGRFRGEAEEQAARVTGAGVVIDASGLILTQYLVVKPGDRHFVTTTAGDELPAEIVGADPRSGLAVLRARTDKLQPLKFGQAEDLRKGNLVIAVGNPFAIESDGQPSVSYGMVSNLAQKAPGGENLNDTERGDEYRTTLHHLGTLIQTDAKLGWNASGGALVNLQGELIGLITSVASIAGHEQPAGYAIPINKVMRRVIEDLCAGREVEYGLLGIGFEPDHLVAVGSGIQGVVVNHVYEGSAADRAGLRKTDVVVAIDGEDLDGSDELQLVVGGLAPGVETPLAYLRDGRRNNTTVRLDKIYVPGEKVVTSPRPAWQGMHVDYATAVDTTLLAQASSQGHIDRDGCVAVVEVDEGSVSWRQGIRPGMFISHVSGQRVSNPEEFREAVQQAGDSVRLRFTPGNTPQNAKPVERPAIP
ncbi:putative periplasmic serine endoprotease DegP-like precursor [Posidoniimonas polymericola]|uniref:Putative periplasmic serine endoprotease DegP-like n=1 Tax=Posidoniimonas polymericola TaxID=2528002 RepID=A0A5C5YR09_9BACT|nr:trypsin-like peptidase domain-containing protein [Posidoniimonas polymericola]TWT77374.1 putative periplasmic serine endoprotease DegP-like precursor [Posidoniimonas polymericola]